MDGSKLAPSDLAQVQFVHEMKLWSNRYYLLSTVAGLNVAFFLFMCLPKRVNIVANVFFAGCGFFVTRNWMLRNSLDRIYYPMEDVLKGLTNSEKEIARDD